MTVYLVGAGPGDPALITVRGAELLARADVVVHDRLSAVELLRLAPDDAELIDVGKTPGAASVPQDDINRLLVEHGLTGATVVRLKGGDPYVFARGGEEAAALARSGVEYEVVPGITSAIAVPAAAGIPVTRRYSSTSLTIVTGHEDPAKDLASVDWGAIAKVGGTIVVLMGMSHLHDICRRLIDGGLPPDTPAAAIRWGTRPTQTVVRSTLGALDADVHAAGLGSPATVVVGDVAGERLDWFERRPLFGRRVVVTRTREQASELSSRLAELGADVTEAPTILVAAPLDGGAGLRDAIGRLAPGDWVVVTSPNGAARFCEAVAEVGGDGRRLGGVRLAAIGPGTAAVLASRFLHADLVPSRFVAEGLVEDFPEAPAQGSRRVLLARAEVARDVVPEGLAAKGWDVEVVVAYRTVPADLDPSVLDRLADAELVTFMSSSSVERFVETYGRAALPHAVASIGPVTSTTAARLGIAVDVEADPHNLDGLVSAVLDWARGTRSSSGR